MRLNFQLKPPVFCAKCDYPNIRIGALRIFARTHGNGVCDGGWMLFSWHWQNSITWRSALSWRPGFGLWFTRWAGPNGYGFTVVKTPGGIFRYAWQPNMWKSESDSLDNLRKRERSADALKPLNGYTEND